MSKSQSHWAQLAKTPEYSHLIQFWMFPVSEWHFLHFFCTSFPCSFHFEKYLVLIRGSKGKNIPPRLHQWSDERDTGLLHQKKKVERKESKTDRKPKLISDNDTREPVSYNTVFYMSDVLHSAHWYFFLN